ncbi:hypothetical protein [Runella sp. SP2]|uniref:hypothetical protein n=1 Tax=Runella sp. SP2 TaxID=2268026 RepID=UPI000F0757C2|nr:hypothetical protein [Runella sp. SP2]AYQ32156.1 hypothetical protein DTQ70_08195 [Runella sp. SP2]
MKNLEQLQKRLLQIRYVRDEEREEYRSLMEEIYNLGKTEDVFRVLCSGVVDESVDANNDVIYDAWREYIEHFYPLYEEEKYINQLLNNANIFIPHATMIFSYLIFRLLNDENIQKKIMNALANISSANNPNYFIIKDIFLNNLKRDKPHPLSKNILDSFKEE